MGKKKSVVLMTLITIVIVVLNALTAFPVFTLPGTNGVKDWNPAVLQYDLGSDFGGGYYAYYYPQGVITETEYNENVAALEGEELTEYQNSYSRYGKTSLYLSTDPNDGIFTEGNKKSVSVAFKESFEKATKLVTARFAERAAKTGSDYSVSVVDDYAIRVQISSGENSKDKEEGINQEFGISRYLLFSH